MFLDRHMEVRAAKAERRNPRTARQPFRADPGPGLVGDIERNIRLAQAGVRRGAAAMRRQNAVVHRQGRLDQPGNPRRSLGMADQRLDRADGRLLGRSARLLQKPCHRRHLGGVSGDGPGAMRLEQPHCRGGISRHVIGPPQGADLPIRMRRGHRLGLAVGGSADALDHGVNPVAIALGILQPLQGNHRQTFGNHDPVGVFLKGRALTAWGKCPGF